MKWLRSLLALVACAPLATCGDDVAGANDGKRGLSITAGSGVTDTINAIPTQGLVVRVLGDDGAPEVGVEVRFDASAASSRMFVASVSASSFGAVAGVTTDPSGRATVRVKLGNTTGPGAIAVSVPLFNLSDTARYTVTPGAAARVAIEPRDTTIGLGSVVTLRGSVRDRLNNARTDAVTFEAVTPAVRVDGAGRLTAQALGAGYVRIRATVAGAPVVDSARVSVVPAGQVLAVRASALVLSDVGGGNSKQLYTGSIGAPAWSPSGDRVVLPQGSSLLVLDASGSVLSTLTFPDASNPQWPEYSRDGRWVYFNAARSGRQAIFRVRPDGTGLEMIPGTEDGTRPSVSPDGTEIVYVGGSGLIVLTLATGAKRALPTASPRGPRWAPDNSWIAYVREGLGELMLIKPDGTGLHRIGEHGLYEGMSWSPDAKWIVGWENRATLVDVAAGTMSYLPWTGTLPAWKP